MALTITANGDASLTISGTSTTLNEVYARLEFGCPKSGESMNAALYVYATKALYESAPNSLLRLDELITNFNVDVVAPAIQSLQVGHEGVKAELETLGYTVEIVDL